jgi:acyl-CoA synthetase (NDP forming)/RimJ/RimL family protein N-acetyltransferase
MFRIIPEGKDFNEHVLLKNGQGVLFRPFNESDFPIIESFMSNISRENLRMRFMASMSYVPKNLIENMCRGDFKDAGCLVAVIGESENEKIIGLGNYISTGNGRTAEVAFIVDDSFQGLGVSSLLLERLAGLAAANGYVELEAEVLPENQPMLHVFKNSGLQSHQVWSSDTVHIELPVKGGAATWRRAELLERISVANSLHPLLSPKVIAVIGASRDNTSLGHMIFRNILHNRFQGTVYPVNYEADSVNGVKAYSAIKDIPEKIDLAVISVPAESVFEVAEKSIKHGAQGLLVVSAGFAEAGTEGLERQKRLVELVRTNGVRLLGPSCLGLINTDPEIRLNASLAPGLGTYGNAGFFSHSAALGLVILEYAISKGIGFTTFVSAGNRADISGNDLLQYWMEDSNTKMAILYLETFGNPRKYVRIARRMSYKKPILCVKSAKSSAGRKAAEEKSGELSGGVRQVEALFSQTGTILAETLDELFDIALVIGNQPLPRGNGVSIIANSAGMATIFADASEANGLELKGPGFVNLGAFTNAENYEEKVYEALINDDVDSLLVGYACVGVCSTEPVAEAIKRGVCAAEKETGILKPVLLCLMGETGTIKLIAEDNKTHRKFPAFRFPEIAARALGKVVKYVEFRNKPLGKIAWYDDVNATEARRIVQSILTENQSDSELINIDFDSANSIFKLFNINYSDNNDLNTLKIKVKSDKLFGPLIQILKDDGKKITRITPLTDNDLSVILTELKIENANGFTECLGKISQMIEEIPWLWELEISAALTDEPIINDRFKMVLNSKAKSRPDY